MNSFKEKFKIAKILASLFTHSSTPEEEKNYRAWLDENPEHQKIADRILNKETYEENSRLIKSFSSQKAWEKVYPLLGGNQSGTVFSWKKSLKYAALILLLLVPASYFIYHWISEETISDITPGTLGGELILSDGKSFNLSDNNLPENAVRAFVIDSKGINYQIPANKPQVKEIQNTLRTLQGMECLITLSDGTRVHLNAETRLTYPVCFSSKERIVQIEGEAYFEVNKNKKHPFIVQTETIDVQVLGTHFNVDAYQNNPDVKTTLLTGSVAVSNKSKSVRVILKPNEIAIYNKVEEKLTCKVLENVEDEISWRQGEFIFDDLPLQEIARELSNSFGATIHIADTALQNFRITASFRNGEDLTTILSVLHNAGYFDYSQNNKQIIITAKPD